MRPQLWLTQYSSDSISFKTNLLRSLLHVSLLPLQIGTIYQLLSFAFKWRNRDFKTILAEPGCRPLTECLQTITFSSAALIIHYIQNWTMTTSEASVWSLKGLSEQHLGHIWEGETELIWNEKWLSKWIFFICLFTERTKACEGYLTIMGLRCLGSNNSRMAALCCPAHLKQCCLPKVKSHTVCDRNTWVGLAFSYAGSRLKLQKVDCVDGRITWDPLGAVGDTGKWWMSRSMNAGR